MERIRPDSGIESVTRLNTFSWFQSRKAWICSFVIKYSIVQKRHLLNSDMILDISISIYLKSRSWFQSGSLRSIRNLEGKFAGPIRTQWARVFFHTRTAASYHYKRNNYEPGFFPCRTVCRPISQSSRVSLKLDAEWPWKPPRNDPVSKDYTFERGV